MMEKYLPALRGSWLITYLGTVIVSALVGGKVLYSIFGVETPDWFIFIAACLIGLVSMRIAHSLENLLFGGE